MPKPPSMPAMPASNALATSVIGKDLHIGGEKIIIVCESRLQVDGEIVGDIASREIVIGQTASVTGSVAAESIEVLGNVNGAIRGMRVALKPSAKVDGDIVHQILTIDEGAHFDGRVRRAKDDGEVKPILAFAFADDMAAAAIESVRGSARDFAIRYASGLSRQNRHRVRLAQRFRRDRWATRYY